MSIEGTVVEWDQNSQTMIGRVQTVHMGTAMILMDDGAYDPETWPDGLIFVNTDKLRVVK